MNLKGLLYRELGEGLTERELAAMIGVSLGTVTNILDDKLPQDPAIWEKFARYFHMDADFLRTGRSKHTKTTGTDHSAAGEIRKLPLLEWGHMAQIAARQTLPDVIQAEALIEATDVPGTRTFAVKVPDDSMEPLFSEGEMLFVNPDAEWKSGDYVIAKHRDGEPETILLRQLKRMGSQQILHPLNRKYDDLPLKGQDAMWGKVVR